MLFTKYYLGDQEVDRACGYCGIEKKYIQVFGWET